MMTRSQRLLLGKGQQRLATDFIEIVRQRLGARWNNVLGGWWALPDTTPARAGLLKHG